MLRFQRILKSSHEVITCTHMQSHINGMVHIVQRCGNIEYAHLHCHLSMTFVYKYLPSSQLRDKIQWLQCIRNKCFSKLKSIITLIHFSFFFILRLLVLTDRRTLYLLFSASFFVFNFIFHLTLIFLSKHLIFSSQNFTTFFSNVYV